ncbi:glycosyltransferase family 4 protein [bacterium]|nr:glycosyltransferase family 4 protein [bacterium]
MNAPRLLYVLDRFPTDTLNFVYNEMRALEAAGFGVEIVSLRPPGPCPAEARGYLARTQVLRPIPPGRLLRAWLHYALRRPRALAGLFGTVLEDAGPAKALHNLAHLAVGVVFAYSVRERPAQIHAHFAYKAALAGLCAKRLNGSGFSFTAHGSDTVMPARRHSLKSKLRGADFAIAISEYNRRTLLALCPELPAGQVRLQRTGIRLAEFPFQPRPARRGGPVRLACVASLYPVKNHEGLLAACALLAARGQTFRLDLVGKDEGGRRAQLEAQARRLGILEAVRFHGSVDHGEVARFLAEADLFVLASHSEGIPVSMMEAMAVGLPVVGPRVTGLPELVEDGVSGLLADPARPDAFAAAIARLLDDPAAAAAMARRARARIEADYDMDRNAQALAQWLRERLA